MRIREAALETVCGPTSRLPAHSEPEIAFAGRSNVGKSSLLNALAGRKSLARTGATPGKTQTINFYHISGYAEYAQAAEAAAPEDAAAREGREDAAVARELLQGYLVDLPGYGYAKASREAIRSWSGLIERYLTHSPQLAALFLLLDLRRTPGGHDRLMYEWAASAGCPVIIVATKADKIKRSQMHTQLRQLKAAFPEGTMVIPFSAVTRSGLDKVWAAAEPYLERS